ncbi:restriction endonuclease subunit S [Corynebacterium striatum]
MATQQQNIGEVLQFFNEARRPVKSSDRVPGPFPYLGASGTVDYVEGFTHEGSYLCVSEDGANLLTRSHPIAWVQDGQFWANNHLQVLGGVSREHLTFFRYAIESTNIAAYVTGSAQPKLSKANLSSVKVPKFSRGEEERIGKLLSAIDDKIAANNRAKNIALDLIKTLGGKPTNTVKLSVLCERSTRSIKPETIEAKTVLHHSLPAFDLGAPAQEDPATIKSHKFSLERPCVLLSKLNPHTPRIWSVPVINEDVPMIASSEFVVLQPTTCRQAQLFAATVQPELFHHLESLTGGTSKSHQRVRPADILTSEVPDTRTLSAEESQMLELLTLRFESFVAENQALARTRDELLPLLMSGRITVGEAEDVAGTAASES